MSHRGRASGRRRAASGTTCPLSVGYMVGALLVLLVAAFPAVSLSQPAVSTLETRVEQERAVERARHRFLLNATRPFDEAYPRAVFEERVRMQQRKEAALQRVFGVTLDASHLAEEYARIESSTRAPEQWRAIKEALANDRELIEEVVCRPLLVDRALRRKFDFDRGVQAEPHARARAARAQFLAGRTPVTASRRLLLPTDEAVSVDALLSKARSESSGPRVLSAAPGHADAALPVTLAMGAAFERELKEPGDTTTILEDRDTFQVMRLVAREGSAFRVDAVTVRKRNFEDWLAEVPRP